MKKYRIVQTYKAWANSERFEIQRKNHWYSRWKGLGFDHGDLETAKSKISDLRIAEQNLHREKHYKHKVVAE